MEGKRQYLLDGLRGLTLISMILYHGMFDLVEIYGVHVSWEERTGGVSRRSVGKCGNLDLYAGGTNYIWNSDISGKCHAPAGVVEAVA